MATLRSSRQISLFDVFGYGNAVALTRTGGCSDAPQPGLESHLNNIGLQLAATLHKYLPCVLVPIDLLFFRYYTFFISDASQSNPYEHHFCVGNGRTGYVHVENSYGHAASIL